MITSYPRWVNGQAFSRWIHAVPRRYHMGMLPVNVLESPSELGQAVRCTLATGYAVMALVFVSAQYVTVPNDGPGH